jgi:hypothetical protein
LILKERQVLEGTIYCHWNLTSNHKTITRYSTM